MSPLDAPLSTCSQDELTRKRAKVEVRVLMHFLSENDTLGCPDGESGGVTLEHFFFFYSRSLG